MEKPSWAQLNWMDRFLFAVEQVQLRHCEKIANQLATFLTGPHACLLQFSTQMSNNAHVPLNFLPWKVIFRLETSIIHWETWLFVLVIAIADYCLLIAGFYYFFIAVKDVSAAQHTVLRQRRGE